VLQEREYFFFHGCPLKRQRGSRGKQWLCEGKDFNEGCE